MKFQVIAGRILLIIAGMCTSAYAIAEPQYNLSEIKQELKQYHDSGAYERDLNTAISQARVYLDQRLQNTKDVKKLAIVYDIDETSLSNYDHILANDFGGSWSYVEATINAGDAKAIEPTLAFYNYVKSKDVRQFFITGRFEKDRAVTMRNLENVGYSGWQALYLKPNNLKVKSAADYKSQVRKKIEAEGYDIILSIGDQQSDLAGGYEDKGIKLPNPYYFIA